jgi:hypothetical protein
MAHQVADRIQQTGTANTTVSFTLSATTAGYQSFSSAITVGNTTYYSANDGTNWEVGIGTLTNSTTLTRTTILSSSNSGSAVTFSGTVTVFCDYPAGTAVYSSNIPSTSGYVLTSNGSGIVPSWQPSSGGGGSPAGSNTQVQYNNSGAFGASSGLTFTGNDLNIPFGTSNSATSSAKIALALSMIA